MNISTNLHGSAKCVITANKAEDTVWNRYTFYDKDGNQIFELTVFDNQMQVIGGMSMTLEPTHE